MRSIYWSSDVCSSDRYYFLWAHLVDQVAGRATAWIESQRAQGREVDYDRMRLWGFPYRLSVTFENLRWHDPQSAADRSEEHTSELQSLMRISYAVFCLKKKKTDTVHNKTSNNYTHPSANVNTHKQSPY